MQGLFLVVVLASLVAVEGECLGYPIQKDFEPPTKQELNHCEWLQDEACCDEEVTEFFGRVAFPSLETLFATCKSCAATWERVLCTAACHPDQTSFVQVPKLPHEWGIVYMCQSLCDTIYLSCKDDTDWGEHGEAGLPIKVAYDNAKLFCEDGLKLNSYRGSIHIKVVDDQDPVRGKGHCMDASHLKRTPEEEEEEGDEAFFLQAYCDTGAHHSIHRVSLVLLTFIACFVSLGVVANVLERYHVQVVSESTVMIGLGMIVGGIVLSQVGDAATRMLAFQQELFTLVLLPPIIFESGYTLRQKQFHENLDAILVHAVAGTLIATCVIGIMLYACSGVIDPSGTIKFWDWMTFASLISAVDPVATLAVFQSLAVDRRLELVCFGEALINDAVAIVLFHVFRVFMDDGHHNPTFLTGIGTFMTLAVGSAVVGVGIGFLASLLFKYLHFHDEHYLLETVVFVTITWSSYVISEVCGFSGILASLVCGLVCEHYTYSNLSKKGKEHTVALYKQLAAFADMIIFFLVGLLVVTELQFINWPITIVTFLLMLFARAVSVFGLTAIINRWRNPEARIPQNHQVMLWFAGLRGAIAIALSLDLPTSNRHIFVATTVAIAVCTVVVFGGGTSAMLNYLNIDIGVVPVKKIENTYTASELEQLTGWEKFDIRVLKKLFVRSSAFLHRPNQVGHNTEMAPTNAPVKAPCAWAKVKDPASGHYYYYNEASDTSEWTEPADYFE